MYLYFDKNGVLQEVINDKKIRSASDGANRILAYIEGDLEIDEINVVIKRADGSLSNEVSILNNKIYASIPYDKQRDLKFFKDFVEYPFYYYDLTFNDLQYSGLAYATITIYADGKAYAQGMVTFNIEKSVIKTDNLITQSQYQYLLLSYASRTLNEQTGKDLDTLITEKVDSHQDSQFDERFSLYKNQVDALIETQNEEINNFKNAVDNELSNQNTTIQGLGQLQPSGTDTSTNILSYTSSKGIYVATDNGHWYYWNASENKYVDGGVYQTDLRYDELFNCIENIISCNNITYTENKIVSWGGQPSDNTDYKYSQFIKVRPNTKYYFYRSEFFVSWYESNAFNTYIKTEVTNNTYLTSPSNAKYMVLSDNKNRTIYYSTLNQDILEMYKNILQNKTDILKRLNFEQKGMVSTLGDVSTYNSSIVSFMSVNVPTGLPTENYAGNNLLITIRQNEESVSNYDAQTLIVMTEDYTHIYYRLYYNGWNNWAPSISGSNNIIEVGTGKQFTTLKDGIAEAIKYKNTKVIVYPGIYDLTIEFSDGIADQTARGICLKNNVYVQFLGGAYVKANFDNSNTWIYHNFQPFYSDGSFTLDGLNIEASNCRYCVHDEHGDRQGDYYHAYKNCIMKYSNTYSEVIYTQCIGGGLGEHGYIDIDGGYYESNTTHPYSGATLEESQRVISYHNYFGENADSKIVIKNVYLANNGRFKFGMYGDSTIKSKVIVSGCSMGKNTILGFETSSSVNENFELVEFNNTVRN